jgi:hypothetical protein
MAELHAMVAEAKNGTCYTTQPALPRTVEQASPSPAKSTRQKSTAGRARVHDRDEAIAFAKKLLADRGDPKQALNATTGWRSDTDIARHVADHLEKHDKEQAPPEVSTVSKWLRPVLGEYRAQQTYTDSG